MKLKFLIAILLLSVLIAGFLVLSDTVILPSVDFFPDKEKDYGMMVEHYRKAENLRNREKFNESILEYESGVELARKLNDTIFLPRLLTGLARSYERVYDYQTMSFPAKEASVLFARTGNDSGWYDSEMLLAKSYLHLDRYDSAEIIYRRMLESENPVAKAQRTNTMVDYGILLYYDSLYEDALKMMDPSLIRSKDRAWIHEYGILAELLARSGQITRSRETLDTLKPKTIREKFWYYYFKRNCAYLLGEESEYYRYIDSANNFNLQMMEPVMTQPVSREQRDISRESLAIKQKASSAMKLTGAVLIVLILMITTISGIAIGRFLRKRRDAIRMAKARYAEYEAEFNDLRVRLTRLNEEKWLNRSFFEEIKKAYTDFDNLCNAYFSCPDLIEGEAQLRKQIRDILESLSAPERLAEFRDIVNREYHGLLQQLGEEGFSEENLTILAFAICGFSNGMIGHILNMKKGTVATRKSRLKIGLKEELRHLLDRSS